MRSWRICVAIALLGAVGLLGDSFVRIVRISLLDGRAEVSHAATADGGRQWTTAILNAPIVEGESIRTRANSRAEIQLECGSALRLTPSAEISFPRLRLRDDGIRITRVRVDFGTAFFSIQKADAPDFQVSVEGRNGGDAIATPNGSADFRVDAPVDATARIELLDGHAKIHIAGSWTDLRRNATLDLPLSGKAVFVANAAPDQWTRWNRRRDQLYERAFASAQPRPTIGDGSASGPPMGVPPPATVSILNPGGSFDTLDATMLGPNPFPRIQNLPLVPFCSNN